ncbi:hypothetical protein SERLA73DRAFT_13166, partial [Serpula lacrymans var. lacrymans S7.3]
EDSTTVPDTQPHTRNASYAGDSVNRLLVMNKKSLPDLRKANFEIDPEGRPLESPMPGTTNYFENRPTVQPESFAASPLPHRQDSLSDAQPFIYGAKPLTPSPPSAYSDSIDRTIPPVPPMELERNSYFRRLSALPAATISSNLPPSLLSLVEAARSILFSTSQVYQCLSHYTVYTLDNQLSSVIKKVIDPANAYMTQLVDALDRFDTMSKKTTPGPGLCRAVIECSRDTAAVFGKAIGIVALQLKVLAAKNDVRFMRQLHLIFYGAIAEISFAWQAMAPHIESIKPLL